MDLPNFTQEQYTSTIEPYMYLYQYKNDKFILSQLKEKMKQQATKVGVKSFMAMWNAFLENQQKMEGIKLDNVTEFENQPFELMSGKYQCTEYGVSMVDKYGDEVEICRHPLMPIQRLINIDTGEEHLRIAYKKGFTWRNIIVEKSVIASSSKIIELANLGIAVNSENAKLLSSYIFDIEHLNYLSILEERSVGRLGWVGENEFAPYVENLNFDGEQSFQHIYNSVSQKGDFEKWKSIMLELRQNGIEGRIFLASSFASVLVKPLGLLPFFVHLWGGTEVGKTVSLMIASSVWGNPSVGEYVTTFNSTAVAQEMQAGFLNSLPLCLDELQIQASQGVKDFDKMIYQLTEGVGRSRGSKNGGLQKNKTWRNCILTTGEHPISNANSGGGAINRILEIECQNKVFHDLPKICNIIKDNYGHAGKLFIDYLKQDNVMDKLKTLQQKYYKELLKADSTEKQASSASLVLIADKIITKLFFDDNNALTFDDISKTMAKRSDVDVNKRALNFITGLIATNPNRFKTDDNDEYKGEAWGEVDDNYIFIVKSIFDREMKSEGYNATAFLSWAKRNNMILYDAGKNTKKKRLKSFDSPINCVCLIKSKNDDWESIPDGEQIDAPF